MTALLLLFLFLSLQQVEISLASRHVSDSVE